MISLSRVTTAAFFCMEIAFKLVFVRAFGHAFAPGLDHGWVTQLYVTATVPVTVIWLVAVAGLTHRAERMRMASPASTAAATSRGRLPRLLAGAWCANWSLVVVLVWIRFGPVTSLAAVICLLFAVACGSSVLAHALTTWLVQSRGWVIERAHLVAGRRSSLRWKLIAYGLCMCGAPTMYIGSMAFAVQVHPVESHELLGEIGLQTVAVIAFAVLTSVFVALSILGPVRAMATTMRSLADGAGYAGVARLPLFHNDELGMLSAATNEMLDQLEHSDRERRALHATLERKVEERTAQLREANAQITRDFEQRSRMEYELRQAQRLEAIGRLAAGVAHEINTPVQYVSDSLEFIRSGVGEFTTALDGGDEDALDLPYLREHMPLALDRAREGLMRVTAIIRAMKSFAYPDGREMSAVDLNAAITATLTVARNEYKYVAELHTDLGDLPLVTCHVGDINQVIVNLVVNAAHAIGDVVGSSGAKGRITVTSCRDRDDAVVIVADTGGGIPDAIRDLVFDPFFTTKELGKGSGQGLPICRSIIVDKHGGSLDFETAPDQGTRFIIRLPIAGSSPGTDRAVPSGRQLGASA